MYFRIRTFNHISERGLARLPATRYEIGTSFEDPDAILVRSSDLGALELGPALKAIGRAGAGTNNIPVARASRRGIPVFNAPGANANAVAELVLAMLIVSVRNVIPALRFVRELAPTAIEAGVETAKSRFAGIEITQRTLGVVGLGAIGAMVAQDAASVGMRVIGFDPHLRPENARRLPSSVQCVTQLEELLAAADFVTVHVPLVPGTQHLFDGTRIARMKRGAMLLNFAREGIVDTDSVVDALRAGQLASYVCDFPSAKLAELPQAIVLPHLGACTAEAEENCATMVIDQVRDYLEHGVIHNAVNFPDVHMDRESAYRVGIANSNVPNMLGQISSTMARAGLNIHTMVNHSRHEMAYTLVDVDSAVDDMVIHALGAIEGVLSVRSIPLLDA